MIEIFKHYIILNNMINIIKGDIHIKQINNTKYEFIIINHLIYTHYLNTILSLFKNNNLEIISDIIENNKRIITFKIYNIKTLPVLLKEKDKMLSYLHLELMFKQIGQQLKSLFNDNIGLYDIGLDDFIIINTEKTQYNSIFLFINTNKFHIISNGLINVDKIINKHTLFISPELYNIHKIPTNIHYKTILYSLASLISYLYKPYNNNNNIQNINFYVKHLDNINETKVYWAILRCLDINPINRFHLFI